MQKILRLIPGILFTVALAACGGGGGDDVSTKKVEEDKGGPRGNADLVLHQSVESDQSKKVKIVSSVEALVDESAPLFLEHVIHITHLDQLHKLDFAPSEEGIDPINAQVSLDSSWLKLSGSYAALEIEFHESTLAQVDISVCSKAKQDTVVSEETCSSIQVKPTNATTDPNNDRFTIGGSISGLYDASVFMRIENTGSHVGSSSINRSGTFVLPYYFYPDETYQVTIVQQPNGYQCSLQNGSGTITNANIRNILISCVEVGQNGAPYWVHPMSWTNYISPSGANAFHPRVAIDQAGNIIIVWIQAGSDGKDHVFKSEYRNGVWTYPANRSDYISRPGQNSYGVRVGMSNNGQAVIVWEQSDGTRGRIYKSEYRNGQWQHPSSFSEAISPVGGAATQPDLAMNSTGDVIIAWTQSVSGSYSLQRIYKSEYRNGQWQHPINIDDALNTLGSSSFPTVAINNAGKTLIAWTSILSSARRLFKAEFNAGVWSIQENQAISPSGSPVMTAEHRMQKVAIAQNGDMAIVWTQLNGSGIAQAYKSQFRNGQWQHPAGLGDSFSQNLAGNVNVSAAVAMSPTGEAIVVWSGADTVKRRVYKREFRNGTWSSMPAAASTFISPDASHAYDPVVSMAANGDAVIAWYQLRNNSSGWNTARILMSDRRNGQWRHPATIDDGASPAFGAAAFFPQVAINPSGESILSWYQYSSGIEMIFKSHFTSHN